VRDGISVGSREVSEEPMVLYTPGNPNGRLINLSRSIQTGGRKWERRIERERGIIALIGCA